MVNRIDPAPAVGETSDGGQCPHMHPRLSLPTPPLPPPGRIPGMTQWLTPPCWKGEGRGVGGGGEEITWTTAASQLIERPLGR